MMATANLIEHVQLIHPRPGDTIVASVRHDIDLSPDKFNELHRALSAEFPDQHVVLVQDLKLWIEE